MQASIQGYPVAPALQASSSRSSSDQGMSRQYGLPATRPQLPAHCVRVWDKVAYMGLGNISRGACWKKILRVGLNCSSPYQKYM